MQRPDSLAVKISLTPQIDIDPPAGFGGHMVEAASARTEPSCRTVTLQIQLRTKSCHVHTITRASLPLLQEFRSYRRVPARTSACRFINSKKARSVPASIDFQPCFCPMAQACRACVPNDRQARFDAIFFFFFLFCFFFFFFFFFVLNFRVWSAASGQSSTLTGHLNPFSALPSGCRRLSDLEHGGTLNLRPPICLRRGFAPRNSFQKRNSTVRQSHCPLSGGSAGDEALKGGPFPAAFGRD